VLDDTTGRDEKPVSFGRKNFSLALDSEIEEDAVSLPLARVRRDGTGSFIYDPEYIPPCVQIGASDRLMELLHRLIEMLDAKSDALTRGRQGSRRQQSEYSGHDVATFWLLHAIRSSVAPLRHFMQVKRTHPEQLYVELSRLAGALCTFALDSHPRSLPLYDHENLEASFDALDRHIREHLEIIIPSNCVSIPLRAARPYFTGPVADKRCFGRSRWIFGIRSTAGHAEVITRVPHLVKVCASRYTPELVRRAYPGLPLEHLPSPPSAISPRLDSQYFSVAKEGQCWDSLVQTGEVGIYVPDSIPNAEVELLVLIES
jgi:type VI secretion system protein ImpJ